jgi:hypothetical protein
MTGGNFFKGRRFFYPKYFENKPGAIPGMKGG